ncbi:hypothetical protein SGGMMB4_04826 [Sodalis glossinidius str. 'morsitans']|uniref:Uncharacterized protein n=1 Tax=Sodalis glossinidius (strain morsitans) TaxID=343509 RepID=A0A193QM78_SODGM|nr:hypothetical protein [Sodalis glossinidius]CRL46319.1 hypothetical protein SGGMMB4_04826 [Sodalis glossinidius str. 'morsitans']
MLNYSKGPKNAQMTCALRRDMVTGVASKAGLPGAAVGAGIAAVQNVSLCLLDHDPVNVPIPQVPMSHSYTEQSEDDKIKAKRHQ